MRVLGFALTLLAWMLAARVALADENAHWQAFENNPDCVVWNPYPQEQETVTWSGACTNGKAQGLGSEVRRYVEDGKWKEDKYEGVMKDGKAHGRGVYVAANGSRYDGEWKDDKVHGRGVYVWGPDTDWAGDRYEGEWEDGRMHGRGVYVWGLYSKWGRNRYEGDYKDGRMHGRGTYYYADGKECEGDWRDNKLLGTGKGRSEGRWMKCYPGESGIQFSD